jgi:hypothetical protein
VPNNRKPAAAGLAGPRPQSRATTRPLAGRARFTPCAAAACHVNRRAVPFPRPAQAPQMEDDGPCAVSRSLSLDIQRMASAPLDALPGDLKRETSGHLSAEALAIIRGEVTVERKTLLYSNSLRRWGAWGPLGASWLAPGRSCRGEKGPTPRGRRPWAAMAGTRRRPDQATARALHGPEQTSRPPAGAASRSTRNEPAAGGHARAPRASRDRSRGPCPTRGPNLPGCGRSLGEGQRHPRRGHGNEAAHHCIGAGSPLGRAPPVARAQAPPAASLLAGSTGLAAAGRSN